MGRRMAALRCCCSDRGGEVSRRLVSLLCHLPSELVARLADIQTDGKKRNALHCTALHCCSLCHPPHHERMAERSGADSNDSNRERLALGNHDHV